MRFTRISACILAVLLSACGGNSQPEDGVALARQAAMTRKAGVTGYELEVQQLYVAYFGRAADPAALSSFQSALAAANAPTDIADLTAAYSTNPAVQSLVDSFGYSAESQRLYSSSASSDFVKAVFLNVLGRMPQTAGLAYWSGAIDSGTLSKGDAALAIMVGALTNTSAQGLLDNQLIQNRLAVAENFTTQVGAQNATASYVGPAAAASVRNMLATVTASTDVNAFQSTINAEVQDLLATGISLLAGSATYQDNYGPGAALKFDNPAGVAYDSAGNMYVSDAYDNVIYKITPSLTMTVLAGKLQTRGYADGTGSAALFASPGRLAVDAVGNVYVSDTGNDLVRKITPQGVVSTIAGVQGQTDTDLSLDLKNPAGIAVDTAGNVYVCDMGHGALRKILLGGGMLTYVPNQGWSATVEPAPSTAISTPSGLSIDAAGNLYLTDLGLPQVPNYGSRGVYLISPSGKLTALAGGTYPQGVLNTDGFVSAVSDNHGTVYVSDNYTYQVWTISPSGILAVLAGQSENPFNQNGFGLSATFGWPGQMALAPSGNIAVVDGNNRSIRLVTPTGVVTTLAGPATAVGSLDGAGTAATFNTPNGLVVDGDGNAYVADTDNNTIRKITSTGVVTTIAGTPGVAGSSDGTGFAATFNKPLNVALDPSGNLYVVDSGNSTIRVIAPGGVVSTIAGTAGVAGYADGAGAAAKFSQPTGIAIDASGNVYVGDMLNAVIRKITPNGMVSTFAGLAGSSARVDGPAGTATFKFPGSLAIDGAGNLYVADGTVIRQVTPAGAVATIAGNPNYSGAGDGKGSNAYFYYAAGIAADKAGNVYVANGNYGVVAKLDPTGLVTTIAGGGNPQDLLGHLPGSMTMASGVAVDQNGVLYVTTFYGVLKIRQP